MSRHLDDLDLEALATGRDDLVSPSARAHLADCVACQAEVAAVHADVHAFGSVMRAAVPEVDLAAMVSRAMTAKPEGSTERSLAVEGASSKNRALAAVEASGPLAGAQAEAPSRPATESFFPRPSRSSLGLSLGLGLGAALFCLFLSVREIPRVSDLLGAAESMRTIFFALDRVVRVLVPGAWESVALCGLALTLLVTVPLRRLLSPRLAANVTVALLLVFAMRPGAAFALELDGDLDDRVTVSVDRVSASEALREATESAGLGLVVTLPEDPVVSIHVSKQPLSSVLRAVLGDAPVSVRREGDLIVIRPSPSGGEEPSTAAELDAPTAMDAPSRPPDLLVPDIFSERPAADHANDERDVEASGDKSVRLEYDSDDGALRVGASDARTEAPAPPAKRPSAEGLREVVTFGSDAEVGENERVKEMVTMGGDAHVRGEVVKDVVTMGGDATIDGMVWGDVVTMGGDIVLGKTAVVYGDLVPMGGDIEKSEGAQVGGGEVALGGSSHTVSDDDDDDDHDRDRGEGLLDDIAGNGLRFALLFILGALLASFAPARFNALKRTMARAPLRSIVSGVLGVVGAVVLTVVLTITLIGIPAALVVALGAYIAIHIGMTAVAATLGALLPAKTLHDKPLLELAAGMGVLFGVSLLPVIGWVSLVLTGAIGFGAVLLTRFKERAVGDATG